MQARETMTMGLSPADLREIDETLLGYLREGRVTAAYARKRVLDETQRDSITGAYLGQRLQRFEEHGHVTNLYDSGLYELVRDIREPEKDE